MSGTSLDGTDLALIAVPGVQDPASGSVPPLSVLSVDYLPYSERTVCDLIDQRERFAHNPDLNLSALSEELTSHYADGIHALLRRSGQSPAQIQAVGLHGQTIWHSPPRSVQLGCPGRLAGELGIRVVGNVRQADLLLGGQGAPIMSAVHHCLWGHHGGTSVVVNLGGIANISIISDHRLRYGYDTGPGNTLLDLWCRRHFSCPFDRDGSLARQGRVHAGLLGQMLSYPWFMRAPPRSTDQKYFNARWLDGQLRPFPGIEAIDVLATLTALTAESIVRSLRLCAVGSVDRIILCGGGRRNRALTGHIAGGFEALEPVPSERYGYPGDFIEAIGMAWLAERALAQRPLGIAHLTGASADTVFGTVYSF